MAQWTREWLAVEQGGQRSVPAFDWLLDQPPSVREQLLAIVDAVRSVGPDQWNDRQSHKPMRGNVDHVHEARDRHGQTLYRLFLRWQRDEHRVVLLDGRSKPNNTTLADSDYDEIERLADLADTGSRAFATADDFAMSRLREAE